MIARYDGICRYCGKPTAAGIDHYDVDARAAFHAKCKEEDDAKPDPAQLLLAVRLGYRTAAEHEQIWRAQPHQFVGRRDLVLWCRWCGLRDLAEIHETSPAVGQATDNAGATVSRSETGAVPAAGELNSDTCSINDARGEQDY